MKDVSSNFKTLTELGEPGTVNLDFNRRFLEMLKNVPMIADKSHEIEIDGFVRASDVLCEDKQRKD